MNINEIFEIIDSLTPKYADVLRDICNIESPTRHKEGVDAVCKYITDMAESHGWDVEYCPQTVAGNAACIVMNPNAEGAPICLSGHMDTVHAVGSFGYPPTKRDGDKIYGPGVCDCKGGIVAALLAMDAMERSDYTSRPIKLILQSDEEVGSSLSELDTVRFMCEKAQGAEAFLNLEGNSVGKACIARKGIVTFTFKVKGAEAHSASCATDGANAIVDAAHKIIELDKIKDENGLTCNCAIVSGGTVVNTVPGECVFKANVRFASSEQYEWIVNYVNTLAKTAHVPGCSCTVEETGYRIAMELTERNEDLLGRMNKAFADCGLPTLEGEKRKGGSDAAYITEVGIPCIDSLGIVGHGIHSPGEFAYISSLADAAKRIAAVAVKL